MAHGRATTKGTDFRIVGDKGGTDDPSVKQRGAVGVQRICRPRKPDRREYDAAGVMSIIHIHLGRPSVRPAAARLFIEAIYIHYVPSTTTAPPFQVGLSTTARLEPCFLVAKLSKQYYVV